MTVAAHDKERLDAAEQAWWDRVAHVYARERDLSPVEQHVRDRHRARWADWDVLDLGVGAGRSALGFAPLARSYLGIDYSPRMVEFARRAVAESERVRFAVGDARDLGELGEARFDAVLFTFNGLDSIHPLDRERTIAEIRRVLRPGGLFYFSTHNLFALPLARRPWPAFEARRPQRTALRAVKTAVHNARLSRASRRIDLEAAHRDGLAFVIDGGENFSGPVPYVTPGFQKAQLERAGFEEIEILDPNVCPVSVDAPGRAPWLHYLCRAAVRSA